MLYPRLSLSFEVVTMLEISPIAVGCVTWCNDTSNCKKENIFHPLSVTAIEMWWVIPETNFFLTFHVNFCAVIDIFMMNKQVFNVTLA